MFALLGDAEFSLQTGFDEMSFTRGSDFAEQARIRNKPGLQYVGERLDEHTLAVVFHRLYCNPDEQVQKIERMRQQHLAQPFVLGNGMFYGYFVITGITQRSDAMDDDGGLQSVRLDLTLKEFTGDPNHPLPRPAVKTAQTPAAALKTPTPVITGIEKMARDAVQIAAQIRNGLGVAQRGVRIAQLLKSDPATALMQLPSISDYLLQTAQSLNLIASDATGLASLFTEMRPVTGHIVETLNQIDTAKTALWDTSQGSLADRLGGCASALDAGTSAFMQTTPAFEHVARQIIERRL